MAVGMFMAILDIQIVASSLPEIQAGLGLALDQLSWVQTAYLMAEIIAIPLTGWLTAMLSTRGAFLACVCGFTAASLACAGSTGFWSLIPARIVQGFCGGALIPLVFSANFLMFDWPARTRATLVAGLLAMLAPTLGPSIGGFVTDRLSWHWLFLINVAPGLLAAAATPFLLPRDKVNFAEFRNLDRLPLMLMGSALATLEIGLKQAPQDGWLSPRPLALFASSLISGWNQASAPHRVNRPLVRS